MCKSNKIGAQLCLAVAPIHMQIKQNQGSAVFSCCSYPCANQTKQTTVFSRAQFVIAPIDMQIKRQSLVEEQVK